MSSESLPFNVSLELALGGAGAVSRSAFDSALAQSQTALSWLRLGPAVFFGVALTAYLHW